MLHASPTFVQPFVVPADGNGTHEPPAPAMHDIVARGEGARRQAGYYDQLVLLLNYIYDRIGKPIWYHPTRPNLFHQCTQGDHGHVAVIFVLYWTKCCNM